MSLHWRIVGDDYRWSRLYLDSYCNGNESWMFEFDPESQRQNSECGTHNPRPNPKKCPWARQCPKPRSKTAVVPLAPLQRWHGSVWLFLLPRLKRDWKGKHWVSVENIQAHVTRLLIAWHVNRCRRNIEEFYPFVPIGSINIFFPRKAHYFHNAPCALWK